MYQKAKAGLPLGERKDDGETSMNMLKQHRGNMRNKSQMTTSKTTTGQIADKEGLTSEKTKGGSTSREEKRGGFTLDYIDTSIPETKEEAFDVEQARLKN